MSISIIDADRLWVVTLMRSRDLAKLDLEVICTQCGSHLCDAEADDTLGVLAVEAIRHLNECKGGE